MITQEQLEVKILEHLIFEETIDHILDECKTVAPSNVIIRILKQLLHQKQVVARTPVPGRSSKPGFIYDSDKMDDYTYQATAKGLNRIGK